jgi:hypothetical protein
MSKYLEEAKRQVEAARPVSGFKPETPEDWERALAAFEHLAYAIYRTQGMPHLDAKRLSRLTHGGVVGRILLETAFEGAEHE